MHFRPARGCALLALLSACQQRPQPDLDGTLADVGADRRVGLDLARDAARDTRSLLDLPQGVACAGTPPPGAALADPFPAYSAGSCPLLQAGTNRLVSKGAERSFLLLLPTNPQPGESFPLVFMWHWLGGTAAKMLELGEVQEGANGQRFIAAIPVAKSSSSPISKVSLPWPITILDSKARLEEEFLFFDDMLACIGQQFSVNRQCVSSFGVSAGALFTAQLVGARSTHLASFVSVSGGVGKSGGLSEFIRPWVSPVRRLPALVLWGGSDDKCIGLDFCAASQVLEAVLVTEGSFLVECIHNCKHTIPPFDPLPSLTSFAPLWGFIVEHPFWLKQGQSPFQIGLPGYMPSWCGIGARSAVPRSGPCDPPLCAL